MWTSGHWRTAIGGRWAVSWQAWAWNAPFAVLSVPMVRSLETTADPWLHWTVASAIGYLASGLLLLLAARTLLRHRDTSPVPIVVVVLLGATAGWVKAFVTQWAATAVGVGNAAEHLRPVFAMAIGAVVLPLGALAFDALHRVQTSRNALLEERIELSRLQLQEQQLAEQLRTLVAESINGDLQSALSPLRTGLREDLPIEHQWTRIGDDLLEAAQRRVQRISHELWASTHAQVARLNLLDLLRLGVSTRPYVPALVAGVYVLGSLQTGLVVYGPAWALGLAAVNVTLIVATAPLLRATVRRSRQHGLLVTAVTLAVLGAMLGTQPALLGVRGWGAGTVALICFNACMLPFVGLLTALVYTALRHPDELLADLVREVDEQRVQAWAAQRETKAVTRELAKFVHGTVQSRLMAASLRAERGDAGALQTLRDTVESPLLDFVEQRPLATLRAGMEQAAAAWSGLLDVTVRCPDVTLDARDVRYLAAVAEEALANAARHGWARSVDIDVVCDDGQVHLTVLDDGIGPRIGKPGLGTALFDAEPRAHWSLTARSPGGSRLALTLGATSPP